jgi:hypothetical protein
MTDIVFVLAPPRSFSSVICAMLGQHPQMYGLPELYLFSEETVADWLARCRRIYYPVSDGLLRAVAQICFGEQTDHSVRLAQEWINQRSHLTTGGLLEALAELVHPLIMVEKSPAQVYHIDYLRRSYAMFPRARYIHLVRHPGSYCEAVMRLIGPREALGKAPSWLVHLATFPEYPTAHELKRNCIPDLDPQRGWYHGHTTILQFLLSVPKERQMLIRGEDLLNEPSSGLGAIANWLGLQTDAQAIAQMIHPERSPYACHGPSLAALGNDEFFLQSPALRGGRVKTASLEGPLSWRKDGRELFPTVKEVAHYFGYV